MQGEGILDLGLGRSGADPKCRAENMLATLEFIKNKYGGAEEYLKQKCRFNDEDIQKIRANIIEGGLEK